MFDDFEDNGGEEEDSSDAEYADIDATADDNVFGGTQKDKTSSSEKESIVFLVDCAKTNRLPISKNYFYYGDDADDENTKESEQTQKSSNYVQVALNAYRNVLRDRVVCTPDDEIGLVFYNTKNRSGELEFDNIFVFHELAPITAERVGAIANFIDNGEFGEMLFEDQIGSSNYGEEEDKEKEEENAMIHALWTASHMLSRNAKTRRSAYVFTNDDAVFRSKKEAEGTSSMGTPKKEKKKSKSNRKTAKEATIARCEEMANAGVKLELFPGPKIGDDGKLVERDGEKEYAFQNFDVSEGSFWREALRKFRYARKKREKKEMTRRRKIVMQTLKDAGDDEGGERGELLELDAVRLAERRQAGRHGDRDLVRILREVRQRGLGGGERRAPLGAVHLAVVDLTQEGVVLAEGHLRRARARRAWARGAALPAARRTARLLLGVGGRDLLEQEQVILLVQHVVHRDVGAAERVVVGEHVGVGGAPARDRGVRRDVGAGGDEDGEHGRGRTAFVCR